MLYMHSSYSPENDASGETMYWDRQETESGPGWGSALHSHDRFSGIVCTNSGFLVPSISHNTSILIIQSVSKL